MRAAVGSRRSAGEGNDLCGQLCKTQNTLRNAAPKTLLKPSKLEMALLGFSRSVSSAFRASTLRRFSSISLPYISVGEKGNSAEEFNTNVDDRPNFIHPSAIVHPNAVIGQGVSIGPFCTIGASVVLGNDCHLYAGSHVLGNTHLGDNCVLLTGAVVGDDLPGRTLLGQDNVIGHHSVVGIKCQDMKYLTGNECFLDIGDGNEIREFTSIHRSSKPSDKTVIGNNNLIMGSCHIAHDCKVGNNNILANSTLLAGHVVVEDYSHTAGAVVVHQFCHIGAFSFIGGGSVVSQDVPRYMMVSGERAELRGLNLEGLRRRGFSTEEIRSLRTAYRKLFMANDNDRGLEDRLMEVEHDEGLAMFPAVSSMLLSIRESFTVDRRGICKLRRWSST